MRIITCRYCRFYERIDEQKGDCFGVTVMADKPAEKCPTFQPKFSDFLSGIGGSDVTPL